MHLIFFNLFAPCFFNLHKILSDVEIVNLGKLLNKKSFFILIALNKSFRTCFLFLLDSLFIRF